MYKYIHTFIDLKYIISNNTIYEILPDGKLIIIDEYNIPYYIAGVPCVC